MRQIYSVPRDLLILYIMSTTGSNPGLSARCTEQKCTPMGTSCFAQVIIEELQRFMIDHICKTSLFQYVIVNKKHI